MLPIFDEYAKFLEVKCGLKIKGDRYFMDSQIIKGFTADGEVHRLYRIKVEKDLSMSYLVPDSYEVLGEDGIITHAEVVKLNENRLKFLEYKAYTFIEDMLKKYEDYTPLVPVSTGKDSMVTLYLTRMIKPDAKAIFNNTSLDVADSYRMAKNIENCEIMSPEEGFYPWVRRTKMYPTRFRRACCSIYKTGVMVKNLDKQKKYLMFMGLRNAESNTRSDYGDEWVNTEWGKCEWQGVLPIRTWSELDVWLYIIYRDIPINEKYKKGYSRVGCGIACPFYSESTWVLDEYYYPLLRRRWIKMLAENFVEDGKATTLNCTIREYLEGGWNGGVVRDEPTDEVITEFMEYKGITDRQVAEKYFNNVCTDCGRKLKKDEVALSMKFHGNDTDVFFCRYCFRKEYNCNKETVNRYIKAFKNDGCCLF